MVERVRREQEVTARDTQGTRALLDHLVCKAVGERRVLR